MHIALMDELFHSNPKIERKINQKSLPEVKNKLFCTTMCRLLVKTASLKHARLKKKIRVGLYCCMNASFLQ